MALKSFYNTLAAELIGGLVAHTLPDAIDSFKTAFNKAQAEQLNKPWSNTIPRRDGPGTYTFYSSAGGVMSVGVYRNVEGKIDREGKPAVMVFAGDGQAIIGEGWFRNGLPHREDGPAFVALDPLTGKVTYEEWYRNGEPCQPSQRASVGADNIIPLAQAPTVQPL